MNVTRTVPAALATGAMIGALSLAGCGELTTVGSRAGVDNGHSRLEVTATAYNAVASQTGVGSSPWVAAWGDRLEPGARVVAVSRDLLALGLERGSRIRIKGLEGEYTVLDKTHRRFRRRIDIFMGSDVERAREWGKRKVTISWQPR